MSFSIYDMTSEEVADAIGRRPLAVIPFGSIEQHGPHLPCGTDTTQINDLFVDHDGTIFVTDRVGGGLFVLRPEDDLRATMEDARA
ncbi:MAG TPA: creatininase family protein [Actinomycetota bacterium]|nr:creatininase family protein [Actinomycetota bacterium]